ncbi:hypothetical protein GGQ65_004567 [Rhizobium fabae]|uniref:Uncharacterized protein n=1 Tax=Rhizobium fabae TaxID=573179 RepID=A0A7W6BGU9_9HYPH|nr:hypothetical protein [Rhizobium fabae]
MFRPTRHLPAVRAPLGEDKDERGRKREDCMKAPSAKESTMAQALKGPNTTGLAGLPISGNGKRFQSASDDQADATVISNASSTVIAPCQFPNSKLRTYPKRRGSGSSILVRLEFRWRDRRSRPNQTVHVLSTASTSKSRHRDRRRVDPMGHPAVLSADRGSGGVGCGALTLSGTDPAGSGIRTCSLPNIYVRNPALNAS